jgi:hypothetical protein
VTSSPANRTALRAEENRPAPPSQQHSASAVIGPTPYSRAVSTLAPVPGNLQQPAAQHAEVALQDRQHVQRGGDLQLPGRGQLRGGDRLQRGDTLAGAQALLTQRRRALVEQHRVDALHPGGVLDPQIVIQLEQRAAFQDMRWRDPAFRQAPVGEQLPQVPGVGLVRLRVPLPAPQRRSVRRLRDMRGDPGGGQFPGHIPPPVHPSTANSAAWPVKRPASQAAR